MDEKVRKKKKSLFKWFRKYTLWSTVHKLYFRNCTIYCKITHTNLHTLIHTFTCIQTPGLATEKVSIVWVDPATILFLEFIITGYQLVKYCHKATQISSHTLFQVGAARVKVLEPRQQKRGLLKRDIWPIHLAKEAMYMQEIAQLMYNIFLIILFFNQIQNNNWTDRHLCYLKI